MAPALVLDDCLVELLGILVDVGFDKGIDVVLDVVLDVMLGVGHTSPPGAIEG